MFSKENKLKEVKRLSRQENKISGKSGFHKSKKIKNKTTINYLLEIEEEEEENESVIGNY